MDDLLTALFNSAGWVLACIQQDRQKQYELIRGVMLAERERIAVFVQTLTADNDPQDVAAAIRALDSAAGEG